jgi:hypothetical protein
MIIFTTKRCGTVIPISNIASVDKTQNAIILSLHQKIHHNGIELSTYTVGSPDSYVIDNIYGYIKHTMAGGGITVVPIEE